MQDNYPKDLLKRVIPVWHGDTVYEESVLPLRAKDADPAAELVFPLLYHADEILSVTDMTRAVIYTPGKDYCLDDGNLVIPADSAIHAMDWADYQLFGRDDESPFPFVGGRTDILFGRADPA